MREGGGVFAGHYGITLLVRKQYSLLTLEETKKNGDLYHVALVCFILLSVKAEP